MWVKGAPLHFIVDNNSQKNLILAEVVKRLDLSMKLTHNPTPSACFDNEEISVSENNAIFPMTSSLSKTRYYVIFLPFNIFMFF